ncbi:hypothetical protein P43SY_003737 [Pythium insidiosum]|uniref:aminodeoxychorismate synthase n=1 Tax=Pythium insidiosum TaxID=114742 RepID=A0AAD5Q869_PYTIN|nr:hypothetical protein P43SY_003737 [Pythium insidiosum]
MVMLTPRATRVLTLLIDNYDSYTYNIFQMLAQVNGVAPVVIKNDDFDGQWPRAWAAFAQRVLALRAELEAENSDSDADGDVLVACNVVLSPGPGHPAEPGDFGMCADAIRESAVPLFGVCLGHQGLAQVYGGDVVNAPEVMHGRTSRILVAEQSGLFAFVPSEFEVVRYHSLVVSPKTLPRELRVTARTTDGVIMALEHCTKPQYGVQFHPEAVCSTFGYQLFQNFRDITTRQPPTKCLLSHDGAVTAVPRPVLPTTASPTDWSVHVDRVATGTVALGFAQLAFDALFADAERSFWLDSSNADAAASQATSRFSYMGDGRGPLSSCVEYCVLTNELRVHEAGAAPRVSHDCDVLSYVREITRRFQSLDVVWREENASHETVPFSFRGGFVGFLGYEVLGSGLDDDRDTSVAGLRDAMRQRLMDNEYVPDASLLFADRAVVFDHHDQCVYTLCISSTQEHDTQKAWQRDVSTRLLELSRQYREARAPAPEPSPPLQSDAVVFYPSRSREQYLQDITEVQRLIHDGETYEVCLTNQLRASLALPDPLAFYKVLRRRNPAPYAAFYRSNPSQPVAATATPVSQPLSTYAICCSSPERFLRVAADGWMESKPIKGTRRRGLDAVEDDAIAKELAACPKDRAENMMIADLVRNDFGRVAAIGSVHVPQLMVVETYATVHQLVTTVRALRAEHCDVVDVLRATFPGGSMTGAPKTRTMQIIRQLERQPRGVYSGALGFISLDGSCDLNIIIRTAVLTPHSVSLGSGGAIVALSESDDEYDEMLLKTRALVQAIGSFATGRDGAEGATVATHTERRQE